jgi:hypothetical protein
MQPNKLQINEGNWEEAKGTKVLGEKIQSDLREKSTLSYPIESGRRAFESEGTICDMGIGKEFIFNM